MADYITVREAAEKWGITQRRVQYMCAGGKIEGARRFAHVWMIPEVNERPPDARRKENKQPKRGGMSE